MTYIWMALVGGAVAFPHCLGMCGGFALHLAGGEGRWATLARQVCWHLGRTLTYVFLGALAGFLGHSVNLSQWPVLKALPGYAAGTLMIIMGVLVLGVWPRAARAAGGGAGIISFLFGQFLRKPTATWALVLGLANGFLPCPITLAFLAVAAQTASVPTSMLLMAAMGVGTMWSLLVLGLTGHAVKVQWKRRGAVAVGVLLVLLGSWTILRKAGALPPLPGMDAPALGAPGPSSDCCGAGR